MSGFSFASVILSYFLVGGGMCAGTLLAGILKVDSQVVAYALLGAGAFVGGFIASRASHGSTILEPAIGAIAVIATIVGLASQTYLGQLIWAVAQDETMKFIGGVGATAAVGALVGAFLSEKLLGHSTTSAVPWVAYIAFATFGACLLATIVATFLFVSRQEAAVDELGKLMLVGIGAGCLLSGLASGASARIRPLIAAFLGGGIGVAGFFVLVDRAAASDNKDAAAGIAVLAVGGAIVTLIGTAIGWATVGRNNAD